MDKNNKAFLKNRKCKHCQGFLKVIGVQRLNGNVDFIDYNSRQLHKKCYREFMNQNNVRKMIESIERKIDNHNKAICDDVQL